jgi:phosphoglycolate phosphatase
MIGDRAEDVRAARAHGARAVAAAWGYGSRDELVAAGPDLVAEHVDDVRRWLRADR